MNNNNILIQTMILSCVLKADPAEDAELAKAIMSRCFHPSIMGPEAWEGYTFSDLEIRIKESTDLYGAVLWPSVCMHTYITSAIITYNTNEVHSLFVITNRPWCCVISWRPTVRSTTWQTEM